MNNNKKPTFFVALLPIILMCAILGIGFGFFRYSVEVLMLISACIAGIIALIYGTKWDDMMNEISDKMGKSFGAFSIIIVVGALIGTFILSGSIPMLIYYGLQILNPSMFLVTAFIITAIVSITTGTSFGSTGTVGLALMGIAAGLGVDLAASAGAIISGSYLGDKMSPLSDTTNLAPVAAGCGLYEHIGHMLYTTLPSAVVCLIVYYIAGMSENITVASDQSVVTKMLNDLDTLFNFNLLLLLPIFIILGGSLLKKPTIPVMLLSIFVAAILALIFQQSSVNEVITATFSGWNTNMTDIDISNISNDVISLLKRGGMNNMMTTILKIMCSFAFAGIMTASGFMNIILEKMKTYIKSDGSLVLVTCISGAILAVIIGNAYVPILMVGEMYKEAFKDRNLHMKNLSMVLEDSVTVIVPLAPWTAGGAYMSSTLGVDTFAYLPWTVLCYTCIIFAIIFGFTGIGMKKVANPELQNNN